MSSILRIERVFMFIGRGTELEELNRLYGKDSFEMAVIYGRRRVGKTSLINEFCKHKLSIFYVAIEQNNKGALESFSEKVLEVFPAASSLIDVFISWEKAFEYIEENYKNQITLGDISTSVGFSKAHFSRTFKKITEKNFHNYLNEYRIKKVEELLLDNSITITQLAHTSGFNSIVTFNRIFKQIKGCSPTQYLNKRF